MRSSLHLLLLALSAPFVTSTVSAQRADILPPKAREAVVERAKALMNRDTEAAARLPEKAINPFDPASGQPVVEEPTVVQPIAPARMSDDLQLRKLAGTLNPTGTISLGGDAYLLFGQKKFKVGESLPIVFEGVTYNVLVTDIQSTSFSIRFGEAEIVRPIKPATRP
ncbi:MAG: hypothetical protein ABII82_18035 [Verrucomicrobiota bacterium]